MSQTNYQAILSNLIEPMWKSYCFRVPQALKIFRLLEEHNKRIAFDHISFRTINIPSVSGAALTGQFGQYGYCIHEQATCHEQHLERFWLRHPTPEVPAILISELDYHSLSPKARSILENITNKTTPPWQPNNPPVAQPTLEQFEQLQKESEIAAWFSLYGTCCHYFSLSVNQLERQCDMPKLIKLLMEEGFPLDSRFGLIRGSAEQGLEQVMTLSDQQESSFPDNKKARVSTGCLHFSLRFKNPSGKLYKAFFSKATSN